MEERDCSDSKVFFISLEHILGGKSVSIGRVMLVENLDFL